MASSILKRTGDELKHPAKKPRTEPRLVINPKLPEFSKLSLNNLVSISGNIKPTQFDYLEAASIFQNFTPRFALLQTRYLKLREAKLSQYIKWHDNNVTATNKGVLKLGTKMLGNLARTMGDIREDTHAAYNYSVAHAAALYEAAALISLISISTITPSSLDMVPDIDARLKHVVEYLEDTQARIKRVTQTAVQNALTTDADHTISVVAQTSNTTVPPTTSPSCNTMGIIQSGPRSDDYLVERAKAFEINLASSDILAWDMIVGLDNLKTLLDAHVFHVRNSPNFSNFKFGPPGVLLHGPNGTGKSSVVSSFAKHHNLPAFMISTNVKGSLQGETEKLITNIFNLAKAAQPSILFLDEADGILRNVGPTDSSAASVVAVIKQLWSDLLSEVRPIFVFGATNAPWGIPTNGFSRRFGHVEYVGLPDQQARRKILQSLLGRISTITHDQMEILAQLTEGYTGSDIKAGISSACTARVKECMNAEAWRTVHTPDGYTLLPASLPTGSQPVTFDKLDRDQQGQVRSRNLTFTSVKTFFDSSSPSQQRRTVRDMDVKLHKKWQEGLGINRSIT